MIVHVFPDIGVQSTDFTFSVAGLLVDGDTLTDLGGFQMRWDWENDGVYDTGWLDTLSVSHTYGGQASPGKKLVKVVLRDGNGVLDSMLTRVYLQELIQITNNTSTAGQGNVSVARDGSGRIAFDWRGPQRGPHQIWVVPFPAGEMDQVTYRDDDPSTDDWRQYPEWSPGGDKIAYICSPGIGVVDLKTGFTSVVAYLRSGTMYVRWSPDGRFLLYDDRNSTGLFDFEQDSSSIFLNSGSAGCWSPDGRLIAAIPYVPYIGNYHEEPIPMKIIDFETRAVLREIMVPGSGHRLDWSPDGQWILLGFLHKEGGWPYNQVLYMVHSESGKIITVDFHNELAYLFRPCWSEDMGMIVFDATERHGGGPSELWAITMPGADLFFHRDLPHSADRNGKHVITE